MKGLVLDYFFVPLGFVLMVGYHIWLLHQIKSHPRRTVIGINTIHRLIWVQNMMEEPSKSGVLAVQTLRNNIMASSMLASAVIMLSSVIAVLMSKPEAQPSVFLYGGDNTHLGFSIKVFSILICFLVAFLFNVQSVRYYSQASILINVPVEKISSWSPKLTVDYVGRAVNRGSYFWSLGTRAFYLSFPLFLWLFGPVPMFLCCNVLVLMLYVLDMAVEFDLESSDREKEGEERLPA